MSRLLIKGPKIYAEDGVIENGCLEIVDKKISVLKQDWAPSFAGVTLASESQNFYKNEFKFPSNYSIVPGRIDLHVHGVAGVDVMDATPEALITMSQMLAREGTTSFLATTMSLSVEEIENAIKNVAYTMQHYLFTGAHVLGLHLEGPFIAPSKMGAHEGEFLLKPNVDLLRKWQTLASGAIKLVTLAPELEEAAALIACLQELNIVPAIGHSNASYAQAQQAIDQGCKHITHLFNAMSGLNHRSPGVALAALQNKILCELIADGHHVAWDMLKFVMRVKGQHELCLVTDSMRAKCMPDGQYSLGHQDVIVGQGSARLADGTLAGSVLTMDKAVQNLLQHGICDLSQSIYLCSINPAKQLNIFDEVGSISLGKWGDIVVLDENYSVVLTSCRGEIVFYSGGLSKL